MHKTPTNLRWLRKLLDDPSKHIVFQNAKYDLKMFSFEGIDIYSIKATIDCTLVLSKVLNSVEDHHDLRTLARRHLGISTKDKDEVDEWIKTHKRSFIKEHGRAPNFKDVPLSLVKKRVRWDTKTTLDLYRVLYPRVQKTCPQLYETERQLILVCIDMENTGTLIDITKAEELRAISQQSVKAIQRRLTKLVCPLEVTRKKKGKFIKETVTEFNANSAHHLIAAFTKLGIKLKYKTKPKKNKKGGMSKGGNWCFDEYSLIRYVSKPLASTIYDSGKENWSASKFYDRIHRVVRKHNLKERELLSPLVIKFREQSKLINTYYNHLIEDCVDIQVTPGGRRTGVLHCQFNQSEAKTGRFSSSKPNLQNMPRLLGPRQCFITRKGRRWWLVDYGQVEMRFYVHFSKDMKMASRLSTDLHRHTASDMYGKPPEEITKEERERAATINFAIIYGAGAAQMAETLSKKGAPTTEIAAARFKNRYDRIYPSVKRTGKDLAEELRRKSYITNPYGRRYYIPTKFSYKALNYMCQGTSADLIKKVMLEIWLWLRKINSKTKMLITVHDELIFEVPHSEQKKVVPTLINMMEDPDSFLVPIVVGVDIALKNWSQKQDAEKIKLTGTA